ncbi:DNA-binding protein [Streptomyces sp. HJ7]
MRREASLTQLDTKEIAVLRVDSAQWTDEPNRDWIGFSASLTPDDILKALRGWWRCDAASVAAGGVLPVTLSGFVVAILTNIGTWERNEHGRHSFPAAELAGYVTDLAQPAIELTTRKPADRALAQQLLGTRLISHSGGAIAYVTTNTTTG